jgi:hypothetical protein
MGTGVLGHWRLRLETTTLKRERARMKKERDFFARCGRVLRQGIELMYPTIQRCLDLYPVQLMYRCLKVSLSAKFAAMAPGQHRMTWPHALLTWARLMGAPGMAMYWLGQRC